MPANSNDSTLVYTSMQTFSQRHLYSFGSSISAFELDSAAVQPGSNLTIEVYSDGSLQAYYVEEPF
jgi:hypothetical protein